MERDEKKKIMASAGIAATGLGAALLLGAFNVVDIEFMSAALVAVASWIAATVYTIFKGPKNDGAGSPTG